MLTSISDVLLVYSYAFYPLFGLLLFLEKYVPILVVHYYKTCLNQSKSLLSQKIELLDVLDSNTDPLTSLAAGRHLDVYLLFGLSSPIHIGLTALRNTSGTY